MKDAERSPDRTTTSIESPQPTPLLLVLGATALGVLVLFLLLRQVAFAVDDAFITFRFARNWAEWGAPVFNSFELGPGGQPVEGYSNALWVALLALVHVLGFDLPATFGVLQFLLAALTVVAVAYIARARLGLGLVGQAAAPVLLATSAPFVAWSSGGMETSLFTLLLTLFLAQALCPGRGERPVARGLRLGVLGAGVVLVRAEGLLWVLGALAAVGAGEALRSGEGLRGVARDRRAFVVAGSVVIAATVTQLLLRQGLYAAWLPNTIAAKTGGGTDVIARGAKQVAMWALLCVTPIAAVALTVPALRHSSTRARVGAATCFVLAGGFVMYNTVVGGDWMPFFRFLAPAAPAIALLLAAGVDALPRVPGVVVAAATLAVQPLVLFDVHLAPLGLRESLRFRTFKGGYSTELGRIDKARQNAAIFKRLGQALHAETESGDVLAFGPIGSPGWFAPDLDFVDRNGLVTPSVARRDVRKNLGTAGHEKRVAHAWFLDNGAPTPSLLYAMWVDGLVDVRDPSQMSDLKAVVRRRLTSAREKEAALFERTVLRATPIVEGPAAGCTLLVLERTDREAALRFWGR